MSFFSNQSDIAEDPILRLASRFRASGRARTCNLSIGAYKYTHGRTTVLAAVKGAEYRILLTQETNASTGLHDDSKYTAAIIDLMFGAGGETFVAVISFKKFRLFRELAGCLYVRARHQGTAQVAARPDGRHHAQPLAMPPDRVAIMRNSALANAVHLGRVRRSSLVAVATVATKRELVATHVY